MNWRSADYAWTAAVYTFDLGDPASLADMVQGAAEIPPGVLAVVAEIILGDRAPNRKAAVKLGGGLSPRQVAAAAGAMSQWLAEQSAEIGHEPSRINCGGDKPQPAPLHWPPLSEFDEMDHAERRKLLRERDRETLDGIAGIWGVEPGTLREWARRFDRLHAELFGQS